MANTRRNRAKGAPPGRPRDPHAGPSARERIAAERAARKRAEARRRLLLPITAITAVLAIVIALVAVKLTSAPPTAAGESLAPATVVRQVTTVPPAVLTRASPGQAATPLQTVSTSGPPLTIGGKPAIVFVSEESCPFCAAERWPLVVALSHFGTWSHLDATRSSATDGGCPQPSGLRIL